MKKLQKKRAQLLAAAEVLKGDGTFADDAARAAFDAKMAEIEAIDVQIRALTADDDPEPEPEPKPKPEDVAARAAGAKVERERIVGIQEAVRIAKLDPAMAADMVTRGITIDAARTEIFAKLAENDARTPTRNVLVIGDDAQDKFMRGATNWLLVKSGMAEIVARAENPTAPNVRGIDPGEFRGMTLVDLARFTLERRGRKTSGLDKMRLIADAFTTRTGDITQSTSDFATLLENVMHKMLQAQYAITPDTWSRWMARGTVSDFRGHNRYRFGMFGGLDALSQNGEFKTKAIQDGEKEIVTIATKGNIINVSRQMIINDDMGVFTRLISMLGRAARLSEEIAAYAELAKNSNLGPTLNDTKSMFHADHGNIGSGAAISVNALEADAVKMAEQKDVNSTEFLDLQPAVLLVPRGILGDAKVINDAQFDTSVSNKFQVPNKVRGLFRDIVGTARLSGTRRYLFADPSVAPVFEMAFLESAPEPVIETKDGWNVDGAEMRVRHDFVAAGVDFRGAVTNAGA